MCTAFDEMSQRPGKLPHSQIKQELCICPTEEDLRNYRLITLTPPPGAVTDRINPLGNQPHACGGQGESEQSVWIYQGQIMSDLQ